MNRKSSTFEQVVVAVMVLAATITAAAAWGAVSIAIPDSVDVSSEALTLGSIAEIRGDAALAQIPMGFAPYPGHYRWIARSEVENALLRWGHGDVSVRMSDRVLVTRESQSIRPQQVSDAIRAHFAESHPDIQVDAVEASRGIVVPKGDLDLVVSSPSLSNLRAASVRVDIIVDGRPAKSVWVRTVLSLTREVAVAVRPLSPGEAIGSADVSMEVRRMDRAEDTFGEAEPLVGQIVRRPLRAGEMVTSQDIRQPKAVRRGDQVSLLARGAGFQVSATGLAKEDGRIGDMIEVQNLQSKQIVRAVVTGDKRVCVTIAGGRP